MSDRLRLPICVTEQNGHLVITGEVPFIQTWPTSPKSPTMDKLPRGPGVYALFQQGTLVYIGESENIQERVLSHRRSLHFDRAGWLRVDGAQRLLLEKLLIWHYLPPENKEPKRHDYRMALKQLYKEEVSHENVQGDR